MSCLSAFRNTSHSFARLTVRRGRGGNPPTDRKIKAARCGAVGWPKR